MPCSCERVRAFVPPASRDAPRAFVCRARARRAMPRDATHLAGSGRRRGCARSVVQDTSDRCYNARAALQTAQGDARRRAPSRTPRWVGVMPAATNCAPAAAVFKPRCDAHHNTQRALSACTAAPAAAHPRSTPIGRRIRLAVLPLLVLFARRCIARLEWRRVRACSLGRSSLRGRGGGLAVAALALALRKLRLGSRSGAS